MNPRRVVTGLDDQGRSCVIIDGEVPANMGLGGMVWTTADVPADNSGAEDGSKPFSFELMNGPGSTFQFVRFEPGMPPLMHATDTVDYVVVVSGEVVLELEAGEVTLRGGDFLVQRGVQHSWRCDAPGGAQMVVVTLPALPLDTSAS